MSRAGRFGLARRQYAPTRTSHDPNPPITLESDPSSSISALTAEEAKLAPELWPVVEISGLTTTRRYASEGYPIASASLGTFQGRITQWGGPLWYRLPSAQFTLEAVRYPITIQDFDRDLTKLFEGGEARNVRSAVVKIRLASPSIPQANWRTWFVGRISQSPEGAGPLSWRLTLSTLDDAFRVGKLPPFAFNPFWFPSMANGENYGKALQIIYGIVDSTDGTLVGAVGACTGVYCNAVAGARYVFCGYGDLGHVERVFKDGTIMASTDWSRATVLLPGFQPTQNSAPFLGHRVSCVKLVNDPGNSAKFTFDCTGLTRNGIGGQGTNPVPITNPALQIRHALNNFALPASPWTNGPWFDYSGSSWVDNALLDTAAFDAAATWCEKRGYRGARVIRADTLDNAVDGLALLNDWAGTHSMEAFWKPTGVLSVRPYDPTKSVDLGAIPWLHSHDAERSPVIPIGVGDAEIASELVGDGWEIPSTGAKRAQISAGDRSLTRVVRTQSRPWAVARQRFPSENLKNVTGAFLADRILNAGVSLIDGGPINQWTNVKNVSPQHANQATGAKQPLLKLGAKAGRPSVVFDGIDDVFDGATSSTYIFDAGVNAEDFSAFSAFKLTGVGGTADANDTSPQLNPCVWCDSAGLIGMAVKNVAGQNYLSCFMRTTIPTTVVHNFAIDRNTWYIAHCYQIQGQGNFVAGLKCFTVKSAAGGNMGITSGGSLRIGAGHPAGALYFPGEIYALIIDSNGDLGKQGTKVGYVGGGWRHLIYESLADMLRIPESGWAV